MAGKYVPLFSIRLQHQYNTGFSCKSVQLSPDVATSALMQKLRIKWHQIDNMAYFYVQSKDLNNVQPLVYPSPGDVFRFSLSVEHSNFYNYTNLYGWGGSNVYYFSNQADNVFGSPSQIYLSKAVGSPVAALYDKGRFYYDSASRNIYESAQHPGVASLPSSSNSYSFDISGIMSLPTVGNTDINYTWYNRGATQSFVSELDLCEVAGDSYNFMLPGNTQTETLTAIYGYNPVNNAFDVLVTNPPVYQNYGTAAPQNCNVNLQGLSTGLYQLNVNGLVQTLFVDKSGKLSNGLGIIEIYAVPNNVINENSYALINGDLLTGTLNTNPPVYTINFANNLAYWQYIPATVPVGSSPHLEYIPDLGNIKFYDLYYAATGGLHAINDSVRCGMSQLMIPLTEAIPGATSSNTLVHPQATGPPSSIAPFSNIVTLPLAQVTQLSMEADSTTGLVSQLLVSKNYLNVF